MQLNLNTRLLRLAVAGAAALAILAPATASAACEPDASYSKVFAAWGDGAQYKLAPGGNFEPGSEAWRLSGGARIVATNAAQHVGGAQDHWSLELPPGATATSPETCVSLAEPVFRMFTSGSILGAGYVRAVYGLIGVPAGVATGGAWNPTLPMLTGVGLVGKSFSIRITNIGIGTLRVDDVYIDPYRRG